MDARTILPVHGVHFRPPKGCTAEAHRFPFCSSFGCPVGVMLGNLYGNGRASGFPSGSSSDRI